MQVLIGWISGIWVHRHWFDELMQSYPIETTTKAAYMRVERIGNGRLQYHTTAEMHLY
jgi:hypothetical protein